MKILFLYSEVMGYTLATMRALAKKGVKLHVVHWDRRKLTPFKIGEVHGAAFYPRSRAPLTRLEHLIDEVEFDTAYVSGWMDKDYLSIARTLRRRGVPVVCGFDNQWHGHAKQQVAGLLGGIGYFQRYFSHAWVAGAPQYAYARRLGFASCEIIYDFYSADLALFVKDYAKTIAAKTEAYPHRFLYVGRFHEEKGVDLLVSVWKALGSAHRDWELCLIGCGPLKHTLDLLPGLIVSDFVQPHLLSTQGANSGCFVLPSRHEPWGVVLHEFAAAGLPIVCSDVCGAASAFLIKGWNGYTFRSADADSLAKYMTKIIEMNDATLLEMGRRSHELAWKITPETSAANLMSVVTG